MPFRSISKIEALIFPSFDKIWEAKGSSVQISKKVKGPLFHGREISDHKYW